MIDTELPMIDFLANDRCDRCGAQAHSLARMNGKPELLFCSHHFREHYGKLLDDGWEVVCDSEAMDYMESLSVLKA